MRILKRPRAARRTNMFLKPESLLACVEAMNEEQRDQLLCLLAKHNGLRQLRDLYWREAQAVVAKEPRAEALLACIEGMTPEQKARICNTLAPAQTDDDFIGVSGAELDAFMIAKV